MANKKIQKMFYFSSETSKNLIESRLEDMAVKTQRSSSFIIESILLNALLPKNEEANFIIQNFLYSGKTGGVQKTLDAIFSENAAGINWESKHDNFKPLVEYCIYFSLPTSIDFEDSGHRHYLMSQLMSTIDYIECNMDTYRDTIEYKTYSAQLDFAKRLLKTAEEKPNEIVFRYHFQLIHDCWELLKGWSITYRYLGCLARLCDFQENSISRNKLYDIILEISKEW